MPFDLSFPMDASPPPSQHTPPRLPPRYVPTLTEVVQVSLQAGASTRDELLSLENQERLVHRVMQRVDATVSQRLGEALADLIEAHTALLAPLLHQEIEAVVRKSVSDAIAQELLGQST